MPADWIARAKGTTVNEDGAVFDGTWDSSVCRWA